MRPTFHVIGDRGLLVKYGNSIDIEINKKVRSIAASIRRHRGVVEAVPAYCSITILYNPILIKAHELKDYVSKLKPTDVDSTERTIIVPVCYDGDFGPDIREVASLHGISTGDLVQIHSEAKYYVYMLGFTPGFPFLGGLPEILITPRRSVPRKSVPAGSVGIGGQQTGIYSIKSPGGWQIIGRTPLKLFDPYGSNPCLFRTGDYLKFKPISRREYEGF